MKKVDITHKYYYKYIYITFLIVLSIMVIIRFLLRISKYNSDGITFNLSAIYLLLTWVPCMFLGYLERSNLLLYLKKYHHERWEELTTFLNRRNMYNDFSILKFIFSKDNLNDINIKYLKSQYRKLFILALILFFSYPIIIITLFR